MGGGEGRVAGGDIPDSLTAAMHDMVRNHGSSSCWSCFPGIDCWQGKEDPDTSSFSS